VTLVNKLLLSAAERLDLLIYVKESPAGRHTGTMTVGCIESPFGP